MASTKYEVAQGLLKCQFALRIMYFYIDRYKIERHCFGILIVFVGHRDPAYVDCGLPSQAKR